MPIHTPKTPTSGAANGSSPILTVSQLTAKIKSLIEERFPFVWVQGEISNLRQPPSGHLYFTLKDDAAQISAVIFKGQQVHLKFRPDDGTAITALGRLSVYEPRGSYQIILEHIEPAGRGALQLAFEQLKDRLAEKGYFDPDRKRDLPFLPRSIGLITSPGGAVVHDMLRVMKRRFENMRVDIIPVSVQGADAVPEIVAGIELANWVARSDVVVLARGGGSLEDLQAFNSESVADAIVASRIPIVSAVGHETDYTISDFVADLRAPTPSAAIEMILPEKHELSYRLNSIKRNLINNINSNIKTLKTNYESVALRFVHPRKHLQDLRLKLDDLSSRLSRMVRMSWQVKSQQLSLYTQRLHANPLEFQLDKHQLKYDELSDNLQKSFELLVLEHRNRIQNMSGRLSALNPLAVLKRGYSITRTRPGQKVVTGPDQVDTGQQVDVILAGGQLLCQVKGKSDNGQKKL